MTRPLTPEQQEKHRIMVEQLKAADAFDKTLQARMLADAKRRPRVKDDEGLSKNIRLLSAEELALRLQKQAERTTESSPKAVVVELELQIPAEKKSSETRYTWNNEPNLSKFTKENAVKTMIKQNPMYQNPVIKGIRVALGIVHSDVLKLKSHNHR